MQESSLHAALKIYLSQPGDKIEAPVGGFIVDILRNEKIIEIQTGNFVALKHKLPVLLAKYPICLVYPVPIEKWIIREYFDEERSTVKKRKSPKRGRVEQLFTELVRLPYLASHPNFSLMVLMTKEEEIWQNDGKGSWRRNGWSIIDRRLLDITKRYLFQSPTDYLSLLPENIQIPFTSQQLAATLNISYQLATKMIYSLRKMGIIERIGKSGRAFTYQII